MCTEATVYLLLYTKLNAFVCVALEPKQEQADGSVIWAKRSSTHSKLTRL